MITRVYMFLALWKPVTAIIDTRNSNLTVIAAILSIWQCVSLHIAIQNVLHTGASSFMVISLVPLGNYIPDSLSSAWKHTKEQGWLGFCIAVQWNLL